MSFAAKPIAIPTIPAEANKPTGLIPQITNTMYAQITSVTILLTIINNGSVRTSMAKNRLRSRDKVLIILLDTFNTARVNDNTTQVNTTGVIYFAKPSINPADRVPIMIPTAIIALKIGAFRLTII